jgi:hypothetical protein
MAKQAFKSEASVLGVAQYESALTATEATLISAGRKLLAESKPVRQ